MIILLALFTFSLIPLFADTVENTAMAAETNENTIKADLAVGTIGAAKTVSKDMPIDNELCPVMLGNKVKPGLNVVSDGRIINVCCEGCVKTLKEDAYPHLKNFVYEKDGVKFILKEYLKSRIDTNELTVLDVLAPEQFQIEHIKGAVNLPLDSIETLAATILPKKDAKIIVYCMGYICGSSTVAFRNLVKLGYTNVMDYKGGTSEWKQYYPELVVTEPKK